MAIPRPSGSSASRRAFLAGAGGLAIGAGATISAGATAHVIRGTSATTDERRDSAGPGNTGAYGVLSVIWSVPVTTNAVALTFDDGPDPEFTPKVLEVLARHNTPATFNLMGWNCAQHPDLVAKIVAAGHEVANHSWSHRDLAQIDPAQAMYELSHGRDVIEKLTGLELRFFRPPRGELSGVALKYAAEEHQQILLWSLNGGTGWEPDPATITNHVLSELRSGQIILFHDGIGRGTFDRTSVGARHLIRRRTAEIAALPGIIDAALGRGVKFTTVSGLLAEPRQSSDNSVS